MRLRMRVRVPRSTSSEGEETDPWLDSWWADPNAFEVQRQEGAPGEEPHEVGEPAYRGPSLLRSPCALVAGWSEFLTWTEPGEYEVPGDDHEHRFEGHAEPEYSRSVAAGYQSCSEADAPPRIKWAPPSTLLLREVQGAVLCCKASSVGSRQPSRVTTLMVATDAALI